MKPTKLLLPMLAIVAFGACSKKPAPVSAPQAAVGREANDGDASRREAEERARREAEERARREAEMARNQSILASTVFFDFDSFAIRDDSKRLLDEKVPVLRADPAFSMLIAGHADDRGSTEYNLALGMRRANAVRDYLTGFGINAGRLEVTSFGEEQPLVPGEGESAWSRNRRAEFQPTRR
jgi:peptidoglycan-associated lipoprotein